MTIYNDKELEIVRAITVQTLLGLDNRGRRTSIKCPIHNERNASFVIYPDGDFNCYGCGVNGQNALDLLMLMGYTFPDAVEYLLQHR